MRIGEETLSKVRLPIIPPPHLGPTEIEALISAHAVDHRRLPPTQRIMVGIIGRVQAGEIGAVLAKRQRPFDMKSWQTLVPVVFVDEALAQRLELGDVGVGPPLGESAGGVELRSLIVEVMAHLVANDRANATVIDGGIRIRIKEGRL